MDSWITDVLHVADRPYSWFSHRIFYAFADSEISDFNLSFAIDKNVLGFDISMNRLFYGVNIMQTQ